MKICARAYLLALIGFAFGSSIAPGVFTWLAGALGEVFRAPSVAEWRLAQAFFGLGLGALVWTAFWGGGKESRLARWRIAVNLGIGLGVCIVGAACAYWLLGELRWDIEQVILRPAPGIWDPRFHLVPFAGLLAVILTQIGWRIFTSLWPRMARSETAHNYDY
jgi:hypothetical protein